MKKSLIMATLICVAAVAQATEKKIEMPTAAKPLKVGETCVWQADGKWYQAVCVPGVQTISAKGNVSAVPSDGGYNIYVHMGRPTQDMKPSLPWGRYDKLALEQSGVAVAKDRSL
jgi:hypothetical protein